MKKTVFATILIMVALLLLALPVAAQVEEIVPLWDNVSSSEIDIAFDGESSAVTACTTKQSGVSRMEGTITLYMYSGNQWIIVDSWSNSTTRNTLVVSGNFSAISGTQYKAEYVITAYRNEGTTEETVTQEVIKTCP